MILRFDSSDELQAHVSPDVLKANPNIGASKEFLGHKVGPPKHKYGAERTGHYASKKEAQYAADLELRKQAGEISFWLEQVAFLLPGTYTDKRGRTKRAVHRLDFVVFKYQEYGNEYVRVNKDMWKIEFVEVKGRDLPMGKLKRKQTEELYGIHITVV